MGPGGNSFALYGSGDIAAIPTVAAAKRPTAPPPLPEKKPEGGELSHRVAISRDGGSRDSSSRYGDGISPSGWDGQGYVARRYGGIRGLGHGGYKGRGRGYNSGGGRSSGHQFVALGKSIQEVNNGGLYHHVGDAEQPEKADEKGMKEVKSGGSDHQVVDAEQQKEALESGMKKETNGGGQYHHIRGGGGYRGRGRGYYYSSGRGAAAAGSVVEQEKETVLENGKEEEVGRDNNGGMKKKTNGGMYGPYQYIRGGGYRGRGRGRGYYYSSGRGVAAAGGVVEQENETVSKNDKEDEIGRDNNGGTGVYHQYGYGRGYYRCGGKGYNGGRHGSGYYYNPRVSHQGQETEAAVQLKEAVVEENGSNGDGGFRGGYRGRGYGRGGQGRLYNRLHEGALEEQEKTCDGANPESCGNELQEKYDARQWYKKKNVNGSKRRKAYKENKKKREAAGNLSADDSSEKKAENASEEKTDSTVASSKHTETAPEDPEEKNKTLAEYEKELKEKRMELQASKPEVRRVESNEQFDGMEVVGRKKKGEEEMFIKLKSNKEKLKSKHEDEEKTREAPKPIKITEFLKDYKGGYNCDRGCGDAGVGIKGGYNGRRHQKGTISEKADASVIAMEDPAQFPELKAPEILKA